MHASSHIIKPFGVQSVMSFHFLPPFLFPNLHGPPQLRGGLLYSLALRGGGIFDSRYLAGWWLSGPFGRLAVRSLVSICSGLRGTLINRHILAAAPCRRRIAKIA